MNLTSSKCVLKTWKYENTEERIIEFREALKRSFKQTYLLMSLFIYCSFLYFYIHVDHIWMIWPGLDL